MKLQMNKLLMRRLFKNYFLIVEHAWIECISNHFKFYTNYEVTFGFFFFFFTFGFFVPPPQVIRNVRGKIKMPLYKFTFLIKYIKIFCMKNEIFLEKIFHGTH